MKAVVTQGFLKEAVGRLFTANKKGKGLGTRWVFLKQSGACLRVISDISLSKNLLGMSLDVFSYTSGESEVVRVETELLVASIQKFKKSDGVSIVLSQCKTKLVISAGETSQEISCDVVSLGTHLRFSVEDGPCNDSYPAVPFFQALDSVAWAITKDTQREYMRGVKIERCRDSSLLRMIATNGAVMSVAEAGLFEEAEGQTQASIFYVDTEGAKGSGLNAELVKFVLDQPEVKSLLKEKKQSLDVGVYRYGGFLTVKIDGLTIISKTFGDLFPMWTRAYPDPNTKIRICKRTFLETVNQIQVNRQSIKSNKLKDSDIDLFLEDGRLYFFDRYDPLVRDADVALLDPKDLEGLSKYIAFIKPQANTVAYTSEYQKAPPTYVDYFYRVKLDLLVAATKGLGGKDLFLSFTDMDRALLLEDEHLRTHQVVGPCVVVARPWG